MNGPLLRPPSFIDRVDPRARVLTAGAFALLVAVSSRPATAALALAASLLAVLGTRLRLAQVSGRLMPVNLLVVLLALMLPWSTPGSPLLTLGAAHYSREGLWLVTTIALKANAIVLSLVVLLGTLEVSALGHALAHLYVPEKLIHLLMFTVRYVGVLEQEYERLRGAMRLRGFRPAMNWHTYRSYGYLVGMLLVRSLERSQRILAAMKCRGFRGRFYLLDHFAFSLHDLRFGMVSWILLLGLAAVEWL
jgi:cobalt/nickel transport system permease protein